MKKKILAAATAAGMMLAATGCGSAWSLYRERVSERQEEQSSREDFSDENGSWDFSEESDSREYPEESDSWDFQEENASAYSLEENECFDFQKTHDTQESFSGPISSLREAVFPGGEAPVFYVEEGNYTQPVPILDYWFFDGEAVINSMNITGNEKVKDSNQDGKTDQITCMDGNTGWGKVDYNGDGVFDYMIVMEANDSEIVDFQMEWRDCDYSGSMDEIKIKVSNREDLRRNEFSAEYLYADYQVLDFDTGEADYTNRNRVQIVQMVSTPSESSLQEQQLFRDMDGDGFVDWMQIRRFYDTDDDGVKESMRILNDRDMDGIFEDEYSYDGTIFDNSLIFS